MNLVEWLIYAYACSLCPVLPYSAEQRVILEGHKRRGFRYRPGLLHDPANAPVLSQDEVRRMGLN